jgi:hypothetical protein
MPIANELEGLEDSTGAAEVPEEPRTNKRKAKAPVAPLKPPPTPEELAAAAAYVQSVRYECAGREALRAAEREAARVSTHTGKPRPGGQVYWSTSGRMLCGKCHRYCDHDSVDDPARCMGHGMPVDSAAAAQIHASRVASAALMREEEQRRKASRLAGRIAGRAASQTQA